MKKNNEGRLINIVTALHSEAQPLIQHFGLKKDPRFTLLEFFQNDHVALVVSGIGKVRSAIATTLLLNQNAGGIAVNFGVCGSPEKKNNIGDLFLVNKITDHASGREYFPDVIYKHEFQESSLETFDKPVTLASKVHERMTLVDMEASGFYQAASQFLDADQIVCLKLVSDKLELSHISRDFITGLVEKQISVLKDFFSDLGKWVRPMPEIIPPKENRLLDKLRQHLRLTETQFHQLLDMATSYKIRQGRSLAALQKYLKEPIKTKNDNKHVFEQIRQILVH